MSWMKKAKRADADPMLAFASGGFAPQVRQAVEWRRALGCKIDHAFEAVAACLGTSSRRVRGVWRGEVLRIAHAEAVALHRALRMDRETHIAALRARAAELERQAECDDRQLCLPLSGSGSAGGAGTRR